MSPAPLPSSLRSTEGELSDARLLLKRSRAVAIAQTLAVCGMFYLVNADASAIIRAGLVFQVVLNLGRITNSIVGGRRPDIENKLARLQSALTLVSGFCWGGLFYAIVRQYGLISQPGVLSLDFAAGLAAGGAAAHNMPRLAKIFIASVLFPIFLICTLMPEHHYDIAIVTLALWQLLHNHINAQNAILWKLRDRQESIDALMKMGLEAIVIHENGLIVELNAAGERLFGWPRAEILGKSVAQLIPKFSLAEDEAGAQSEHQEPQETVGLTANGNPIPLESMTQALVQGGRKLHIKSLRDISHQKRNEALLAQQALIEVNFHREQERIALDTIRSKSQFLANMSHEIRTPLNAIVGLTDMLLEEKSHEKQRQYVNILKSSGEHLFNLVNNVLDFSKIDAEKLDIEKIQLSIRNLLSRQTQLMEFKARQQNVQLEMRIDERIPALVIGDDTRLSQILLNLISNAIKFSRGGTVSLRATLTAAHKDEVRVRFEVHDLGIGMTEEQIAALFKPFAQADSSTSRKYGGTGLGLAISHRLVTMLGGSLSVESRIDEGSTFWFELPLGTSEMIEVSAPDAPLKSSVMTSSLIGFRILVAEDNSTNQIVIASILNKLGAECVIVNDGLEAIAAVSATAYDLVLMDCHMPNCDGYDAAIEIRKREIGSGRHLPIIALTASAREEDKNRCLQSGMDGFTTKPVRVSQLQTLLLEKLKRAA